jgi:ribosomal protein L32
MRTGKAGEAAAVAFRHVCRCLITSSRIVASCVKYTGKKVVSRL